MIMFFSATGNCEFAAKRLGEKLGDEVQSLLPKFREKDRSPMYSEKPWVIASPVYVAEMPRIVSEWLRITPLNTRRNRRFRGGFLLCDYFFTGTRIL